MRAMLLLLLLLPLFSAASSEMKGLQGVIKQVEERILELHSRRESLGEELKGLEGLVQYRAVLGEALSAVYFYDTKRVLTTSLEEEGLRVSYSLLHNNFLQIAGREVGSIYLSGLIPLNGVSYYFIGIAHEEGAYLLLYHLNFEPGTSSFLIFNKKGKLLVNNGVGDERLKVLSEQKDSFFPFNFFREYDNYYYIEERDEPEQ